MVATTRRKKTPAPAPAPAPVQSAPVAADVESDNEIESGSESELESESESESESEEESVVVVMEQPKKKSRKRNFSEISEEASFPDPKRVAANPPAVATPEVIAQTPAAASEQTPPNKPLVVTQKQRSRLSAICPSYTNVARIGATAYLTGQALCDPSAQGDAMGFALALGVSLAEVEIVEFGIVRPIGWLFRKTREGVGSLVSRCTLSSAKPLPKP